MGKTRRNYSRLLKQARPYLPRAQRGRLPALKPVPKGGGYAYVTPPEQAISGNPSYRRALKKNPEGARFTTYHELGHLMGAGSEGHANRVANLLLRGQRGKLNKKKARRKIRNTLAIHEREDT